jgi:hypothetical protein
MTAMLSIVCAGTFGQSVDAEKPCSGTTTNILRVERTTAGWPLTFVRKDRALRRFSLDSDARKQESFAAVTYAVSATPISVPYITVNTCEKTAVLSALTLRPAGVIGVSKNGRTFAYITWGALVAGRGAHAVGVGAETNVVFYDLHGTGHFDGVQVGSLKRLPFVPDWVP